MGSMDGFDVALLAVVGYVAVMALVRLMTKRRDQMIDELQEQVKDEQRHKKAEEKKQHQQEEEEEQVA